MDMLQNCRQHAEFLTEQQNTVIALQKQKIETLTEQEENIRNEANAEIERVREDAKRWVDQREEELIELRIRNHTLETHICKQNECITEINQKAQTHANKSQEAEAKCAMLQKELKDLERKLDEEEEKQHLLDTHKEEKAKLLEVEFFIRVFNDHIVEQ
ncbi:myosin heavy chain, muscle [Orussus abietinus]|uniref:myosin heavy chain, muscle n=1 Tax=Orussus abietinus TaxID=222816 RepID=UPI00062631E5|nr:myosin heavy chain, muscle [Orussus abietinus]